MDFEVNKTYELFGKVLSFNLSDGITNMVIGLVDDSQLNIKISIEHNLICDRVYLFSFKCVFNGTRNQFILEKYIDAFECPLTEQVITAFKKFYPYVSVGIPYLEEKLNSYLSSIKNKVIYNLCNDIFSRYKHDFLIYPAAVKMHHNYIGGLAYHTLTMCDLASAFKGIYKSIDMDYLIAGALLHDISKIIEFAGPVESEYSKKGQLLGHLVLGAIELDKTADRLGYSDREEVVLLQHMIISHHGVPQYGACKKPETPEALLLWMIDNIDSKMRVIDETFENVNPGSFSEPLGVMDRCKVYKKIEE